MKTLLLAAALLAMNAMAADVTGTWTGTLTRDGSGDASGAHLVLKQEGTAVTGTAGPSEGEQHAIGKGVVEGDVVRFEIQIESGVIKVTLKPQDDAMEGTMVQERDGESRTGKLALKRKK